MLSTPGELRERVRAFRPEHDPHELFSEPGAGSDLAAPATRDLGQPYRT